MINNHFSMIVGKRLMKVSTISEATGISRTTLTGLYYRRTKKISFDVLDKLCTYLECSVGDILEFEESTENEEGRR